MISRLKKEHISAICEFLPDLSEWFDEEAQKHLPIDIEHQNGYVSTDNKVPVAFCTYVVWEGAIYLTWLGVKKGVQNQGHGKSLLKALCDRALELGLNEIRTWTLGDNVDYEPYDQTRRWYFKNGFTVYQRSTTDNASCPEEIKLKKLVQNNKRLRFQDTYSNLKEMV